MQYVLTILVILAIYFIFIKKKPLRAKTKEEDKKDEQLKSNDMVACKTCGVYTELGETIISNNKYYCSDECVGKS